MLYKLKSVTKFLFTAVFLGSTLLSCNKLLDKKSSRIADEEGSWKSFENARSGLIGIYGLFRAALADNNAHWMWGELRAGDFRSVSRPDLKAVVDGELTAAYPLLERTSNWRRLYAVINAANVFIERVEGCLADKRYTEAYYKLDVAQARSLRAFAYFYMVRIWGDVPFTTSSGDGGNFDALPRTDKNTILSFAEQELIAAANELPYIYSGADPEQKFPPNYYGYGQSQWLNAPVTRLAAYALLAHIAAWKGQYTEVVIYTDFIENNFSKSNVSASSVAFVTSPTGLFSGDATDNYRQILGFRFPKNQKETTVSGHIEQLTLANTVNFTMSKQLPDIYVPKDVIAELFPSAAGNDDRFGYDNRYTPPLLYTTYFENYNAEIPVFKKIRVLDGGTGTGSYAVFNSSIIFTRLEELRLLRAEAYAAIGDNGRALTLLNSLRSNRNLKGVSLSEGGDILKDIFDERRRELMGEGWRWYDIVRYNRIRRNDPEFNKLLDNDGIYWPIAQDVLTRNPELKQNPYWN